MLGAIAEYEYLGLAVFDRHAEKGIQFQTANPIPLAGWVRFLCSILGAIEQLILVQYLNCS